MNVLMLEKNFCKNNGIFLTKDDYILSSLLADVEMASLLQKRILEPSCGDGEVLLSLIKKYHIFNPNKNDTDILISDVMYFNDINELMVFTTVKRIKELYFDLFGENYTGRFNYNISDFSNMENVIFDNVLFDYVIGNPPYISLYGRRDKKKTETQREYYLQNYKQFPSTLKNGKLNYIMFFLERGLSLLKKGGQLSFVIDQTFFETAFLYTRKFLLENYHIKEIEYNMSNFDNVASGQLILKIINNASTEDNILIKNYDSKDCWYVLQKECIVNEYQFKLRNNESIDIILGLIDEKTPNSIYDLWGKKNLRTCTMLLDMENEFIYDTPSNEIESFPYYKGARGLKDKFYPLNSDVFFLFNKDKQDRINDKIKEELTLQGIKNKKRIGLGNIEIYRNPKVYIRQSSKHIVASYDYSESAANNSLYVFSLHGKSPANIEYLMFICGLLNSKLVTFYAQQKNIIRFFKGKQPQIKVSDLGKIKLICDKDVQKKIAEIVTSYYNGNITIDDTCSQIDIIIYKYYGLSADQIDIIEKSISDF